MGKWGFGYGLAWEFMGSILGVTTEGGGVMVGVAAGDKHEDRGGRGKALGSI